MSLAGPTARRALVGGLSAVGLAVAAYLTLYQTKVVPTVWDPFSLGGSSWVLRRSPLVRWLGFPDAVFGAAAYGAELVLDAAAGRLAGGARRRRLVLALGALAAGMAAGSLVLVALQAVYGHWCSLCLVSAGVSVVIAAAVLPDARHALGEQRSQPGRVEATGRALGREPAGAAGAAGAARASGAAGAAGADSVGQTSIHHRRTP